MRCGGWREGEPRSGTPCRPAAVIDRSRWTGADRQARGRAATNRDGGGAQTRSPSTEPESETKKATKAEAKIRRFHGRVPLNPLLVGTDAGKIGDEIISHLAGLANAGVSVTLEIAAELPDGASDQIVRAVTENCRTLKFTAQL
jgi:hypothetical protein